jgi:hypothetical protein
MAFPCDHFKKLNGYRSTMFWAIPGGCRLRNGFIDGSCLIRP